MKEIVVYSNFIAYTSSNDIGMLRRYHSQTFHPEMINETYQHTTADYAKLAFI